MIRNGFSTARWCALIICSAALFGAATANAYTISLTGGMSGGNPGGQPLYQVAGLVPGDSFNVAWGGVSGLNVTGMVTVNSLTSSAASIQVMLDNLSTPISGNDPRVTAVGLAINGYSSLGSTTTGATYLTKEDSSNMPGFTIDACATSGSNCAGGGNGGIPAGLGDTATMLVNGTFAGSLTLSNFGLKIQGGPNGNSFELAGVPTQKVPEPASIALAALAAAMVAVGSRHKR